VFSSTGRCAQVSDAFICDQLTVGQGQLLKARAAHGQMDEGGVSDQHTFLQIHLLQQSAVPGEGLEACVCEL